MSENSTATNAEKYPLPCKQCGAVSHMSCYCPNADARWKVYLQENPNADIPLSVMIAKLCIKIPSEDPQSLREVAMHTTMAWELKNVEDVPNYYSSRRLWNCSWADALKSIRKCGICREPGHDRRKCPVNYSTDCKTLKDIDIRLSADGSVIDATLP